MKKAIIILLIIFFLSVISFQVISANIAEKKTYQSGNSFCGDGICDANENDLIYCGKYPSVKDIDKPETVVEKDYCWISSSGPSGGTCSLDCGNRYKSPEEGKVSTLLNGQVVTIPVEELPVSYLCGNGVCDAEEDGWYICKQYGSNKYGVEEVISGSSCKVACAADCGTIAKNSPTVGNTHELTRLPINVNKYDWIGDLSPNLYIGKCDREREQVYKIYEENYKAKSTGKFSWRFIGKEQRLQICLDKATNEGVQVTIESVKNNMKSIDAPGNLKKETVFIKYGTAYQYEKYKILQGFSESGTHDKYLVPTYNQLIDISKEKKSLVQYFSGLLEFKKQ